MADTRPDHRSSPQGGGGGIRDHPQLLLIQLRAWIILHTEVTRDRHETRQRGFQARDHQAGYAVLHHQRSAHSHIAHLKCDLPIDISPGIVERHTHSRGDHAGESRAQVEIRRTGRLECQFLIVTDHQRQGRVLYPGLHCIPNRDRRGGIAGDHHKGGRIGRGGRSALEGEAARQGYEIGNLGLETIDHHGGDSVLHGHRHAHIDRTDSDGHRLIHIPARVVVGNAHTGGGDRRETVTQADVRRTGGLDHQRLIFIHHQRQGGPLDSHPECVADGQASRGTLGKHDQLIIVGGRSSLLLEGVIAGHRHETTDRGVKPRHQHRRHLVPHHQRSGDGDPIGTHVELLVQVAPGVVVREAHGLHTDPREAAAQAQ